MVDLKSVFNGIHAKTGRALHPARTLAVLAELAERDTGSRVQTGSFSLTDLGLGGGRRHYPLQLDDLDLGDPAQAGWGVVFSARADPGKRAALRELLDHRRGQVSAFDACRY